MEIQRVESRGEEPRLVIEIKEKRTCPICKSMHRRREELCWVCQRLKNSARLTEMDRMEPEE